MIRIVYVISSLRDCGPVTVLYNIVKFLDRNVFEPVVVTLSVEKNDRKKDFQKYGVKIYEFNVSKNPFFNAGVQKVIACVNNLNPQIIHTQCFRSTLFMANNVNAKLCVTLHCVFFQDFVMTYGWFVGNAMTIFFKRALKAYDKVIACSKSISDMLLMKYELKFDYIRNGISIPNEKYAKKSTSNLLNLRDMLGMPADKKILIFTGRICKRKNQMFLFQFREQLQAKNICIVFLGECDNLDNLSELSNEYMIFPGNVDNVYDYLMAADGFVSASLSEGMPNAVLEALMMGLPCLLSDIPSHREIYDAYSEACMLFPLNDARKFIKILDLYDMKLDDSMKNFAHIRDKSVMLFSAMTMSKKYQKVYESMLI